MGLTAAIEQHLLSLEEDLLQPVTRKDAGKLASLLSEDFVEFGSSGRVFDKSSIIATLGDEVPAHSIISQFKASPLGQDTVLVTYRVARRGEPTGIRVDSLRCSVWKHANGAWRLTFHQGTLTSEDDAALAAIRAGERPVPKAHQYSCRAAGRPGIEHTVDRFPELETERLVLRQITIADAEGLFAFFSDPEVMQFYDCEPLSSIEESRRLIRRFSDWFEQQSGFRWGIALKAAPQTVVGTCGLFSWHKPYRTATLGYELSRDHWRRGIMTEAIRAVLAFGFDELELNRVRATVVTSNIASAKFLEHLSFEKEGLLRQAQCVNGRFDDLFAFALLRQQWAA